MRVLSMLAIVPVVLATAPGALASRWVGPGSASGPVEQPAGYLQTISSLELVRLDFDQLPLSANVSYQNLGGVVLYPLQSADSILVQSGVVADAEVATGPNALLVEGGPNGVRQLDFGMTDPVMSFGFVLMGLESAAWLRLVGEAGADLGSYLVGAGYPEERRWIGVYPEGRAICRVELTPLAADAFAIDNIELGYHAPEPSAGLLLMMAGALSCFGPGRRRQAIR